ncbi:diaminobutyrate acetyltransferase [Evansella sp. LMS18]|uniref:diaminobutyrate acetyltransferase n=1 Tax=Evansella sp. LMS18 TaxID=2924033 RepID=UPI0020D05FDF|nr:diaminobutyrate acetyltransferase [Evansella sp. LMS18]UTR10510.1 diaminobutyrate acetyltransferase [Evansella sp. LMS18]
MVFPKRRDFAMTVKTAATIDTEEIVLEKPALNDGAKMWELVNDSTLDLNSPYKYLMMCEYFSETCVVAKENENLAGFITAFIPPERKDVIFVWQVGVDESFRGKGIASRMLKELLSREACKDVRYLEATVTPSNTASKALFTRFALKEDAKCFITPCFPADLFPGDEHESELTYRIGPLK